MQTEHLISRTQEHAQAWALKQGLGFAAQTLRPQGRKNEGWQGEPRVVRAVVTDGVLNVECGLFLPAIDGDTTCTYRLLWTAMAAGLKNA
ncbi:MAG: hypothetical protein FWD16_02210 [Clostridia bacterium]|nr:hypothetical protein [Clostridia bacterium]